MGNIRSSQLQIRNSKIFNKILGNFAFKKVFTLFQHSNYQLNQSEKLISLLNNFDLRLNSKMTVSLFFRELFAIPAPAVSDFGSQKLKKIQRRNFRKLLKKHGSSLDNVNLVFGLKLLNSSYIHSRDQLFKLLSISASKNVSSKLNFYKQNFPGLYIDAVIKVNSRILESQKSPLAVWSSLFLILNCDYLIMLELDVVCNKNFYSTSSKPSPFIYAMT